MGEPALQLAAEPLDRSQQVEPLAGSGLTVGPLGPRLDDVQRIAVLRGGGLGDLLYAVPAAQALADAYPRARLTLLGTPGHAELVTGRPGPFAEAVVLPVAEGVYRPTGTTEDPQARERFLTEMRRRRFDLAVQLHGGGRWSNPFVRQLGARHAVGARAEDAEPLDRWIPYRYYQNEVIRGLEIAALVGALPSSLQPVIRVTGADRRAAAEALAGLPRPLIAVHPSASDARRRWPPERFGTVIARAVRQGAGVAVVGTAGESEIVDQVVAAAAGQLPAEAARVVRGLAGRLSFAGLVGTLAQSAAVLANDSGPGHLALAVGTPTVRLFWIGNVINAGPLGRARHRVHISWAGACPVCGASYTDPLVPRCPHDVSALTEIRADEVAADVLDLLGAAGPDRP